MADLKARYDSVPVVVKLRPDESEYLVCAVVDGAELPVTAVSVAKLNKYLDLAAAAAAEAAAQAPAQPVPGQPAQPAQ